MKARYLITKSAGDLEQAVAYHDEVQMLAGVGPLSKGSPLHTTVWENRLSDESKQEYGDACGVSPWSSMASLETSDYELPINRLTQVHLNMTSRKILSMHASGLCM